MANVKTDDHDHALLGFHPTLRFERADPSVSALPAASQPSAMSAAREEEEEEELPEAFVMPPPPGKRFAPIKDLQKLACFAEEYRKHLRSPPPPAAAAEQHQHSHLLAFSKLGSNTSMHIPPPPPPARSARYTPLPIVFQRRWSSLPLHRRLLSSGRASHVGSTPPRFGSLSPPTWFASLSQQQQQRRGQQGLLQLQNKCRRVVRKINLIL